MVVAHAFALPGYQVMPAAPDFESIYSAEVSYILESLRRLGVRPADVEDVAHEVFVKVYRLLDDYDTSRPIRPWLFGIALRTASDYRRSARFRREVAAESHDAIDDAPRPDDHAELREGRELILRALDALDEDARTVFVAHELDGTPVPDLAALLDVSQNTLYSRLRLGRKQFTAAVRRLQPRRGEA